MRFLFRFARHLTDELQKDEAAVLAGHCAFSMILACFPFVIFLTGLLGLWLDPERIEQILTLGNVFLPAAVIQDLRPVLDNILSQNHKGLLTFSFVGTLWAAAGALDALRGSLVRAYDARGYSSFFKRRFMSIGMILISGLSVSLFAFLLLLSPLLLDYLQNYLPLSLDALKDWNLLRYFLAILFSLMTSFLLHRFLLRHELPNKNLWPGIFLSTFLWILSAALFQSYLEMAPDLSLTYGSLATGIALLLLFYINAYIFILGAEINAVLFRWRRADRQVE